jgi:hypothetical protein
MWKNNSHQKVKHQVETMTSNQLTTDALRQKINEMQARVATEALTKGSTTHVVRQLLGTPQTYNLIDECEKKNRTLPWEDGEWGPGITISEDGNRVTFDFNPPLEAEDDSETIPTTCIPEDLVQFAFFYYEYKAAMSTPRPELLRARDNLQNAQLCLLATRVRSEMQNQAAEIVEKAITELRKQQQ